MMLGSGGGTNTSIGGSAPEAIPSPQATNRVEAPSWNLADRVAERRKWFAWRVKRRWRPSWWPLSVGTKWSMVRGSHKHSFKKFGKRKKQKSAPENLA